LDGTPNGIGPFAALQDFLIRLPRSYLGKAIDALPRIDVLPQSFALAPRNTGLLKIEYSFDFRMPMRTGKKNSGKQQPLCFRPEASGLRKNWNECYIILVC
jgi:hypothetical protein